MATPTSTTEIMLFGHPLSKVFYDLGIGLVVETLKLVIFVFLLALLWETARHYWERLRRKDSRHVSFTVNYIDKEGRLKIRPIGRQIPVEYLFPNPLLRRAFLASAKRTGQVPKHPIMEFTPDIEHDIMSLLRSWITDDFREGYMMAAAGLPTVTKRFIVMPVYEQYPQMTMEQIRVIATDITLIEGAQPDPATITLERPKHHYRLATIASIANFWRFCEKESQKSFVIDIEFPKSWTD